MSKSCPETGAGEDPACIDAEHEPELTDDDILDAMQHVPGYLDISTEDFRVIYHLAWRHAIARLRARQGGKR
jgi:CBS-domain-containing membrane protein